MRGAIPLLSLWAFMGGSRKNFTLPYSKSTFYNPSHLGILTILRNLAVPGIQFFKAIYGKHRETEIENVIEKGMGH